MESVVSLPEGIIIQPSSSTLYTHMCVCVCGVGGVAAGTIFWSVWNAALAAAAVAFIVSSNTYVKSLWAAFAEGGKGDMARKSDLVYTCKNLLRIVLFFGSVFDNTVNSRAPRTERNDATVISIKIHRHLYSSQRGSLKFHSSSLYCYDYMIVT